MTSKTGGSVSKHGTFTSFGRFVSFRAWEKERVARRMSHSHSRRHRDQKVQELACPLHSLLLPSSFLQRTQMENIRGRGEEWRMEGCHIHGLVRQGTGRHDAMGAGRGEGGVTASAVVYCDNGPFCLIRPK